MLGGKLADVLGHRRMVTIGVIGFAVCSALCGATPTGGVGEAWMIGFRVVQGAFAALLFPAALAIVVAAFPVRERGRALAAFFGITGGLTADRPARGRLPDRVDVARDLLDQHPGRDHRARADGEGQARAGRRATCGSTTAAPCWSRPRWA